MAGYLSTGTTVFSNLSLTGDVKTSTVSASVATLATIRPTSSLDLRNGGGVLSMATVADSNSMTIGQLRLVFAASGISLVFSSGATVYTIGASAVSAAQA